MFKLFTNIHFILFQLSVYTMIAGALVAASNDLAFNLNGYVLVILNDIFTATNGVIMKQKLDSAELGNNGVLFYNSLLMLPPGVIVACSNKCSCNHCVH